MKLKNKLIRYKKGAEVISDTIKKIVEFCPVKGTFNFISAAGYLVETKTDNIVSIEAPATQYPVIAIDGFFHEIQF